MKTNTALRLGFLVLSLFLLPLAGRATTYTLTLVAQGPGTVSRNPSNATYPAGVTVTITATPNAGAYFTSWSGDTNSTVNPLNIVMNNNYVITGNFLAYPTYPLTLTTNGQGSIDLNPSGSSFASNTVVTATATPANGWLFTSWTGSAAGPTNPLSFTMNTSNSLTGNFVQLPSFDTQPVGVTNSIGANVGFSAHSVGTAPVSYQWYFNGTGVAGATNTTLNFNNAQFASAGSYQVIATNLYGSATSSVALLVLTNGFSNPVSVCDEPSLRAAIAAGGWIQFGCNGTITLSNTITINNPVILDGSFVNATISGGGKVRIFYVANGASLTITNLTLANGATNNQGLTVPVDGGAIYNSGTLNLVGCSLMNNVVTDSDNYGARGGAIFNNGGNVTLQKTSLGNNLATGFGQGGGIYTYTGVGLGGGIYSSNGSLTLINCTLTNNTCKAYVNAGEGGAVCLMAGTAVFSNCLFSANQSLTTGVANYAMVQGGAVAQLGGNLTIGQCQFVNNQVCSGGAVYISGLMGGGALLCGGTATVWNSSFFSNQVPETTSRGSGTRIAARGGAICILSNLTLNGCCIASNLVWGLDGSQSIGGTSQPGDGLGAGIYNVGQLWMTNCTLAQNLAQGGVPYAPLAGSNGNAIGAGLYTGTNGISLLMNVTIANNVCSTTNIHYNASSFSAGDQIANQGGTLRLHSTLLAYAGTNGNAYGTITDDGYNISSDGSASFSSGSSYNLTDPKLLPLTDNGGPTLTMAPLTNSPAIDTGDSNGAPPIDQRGGPRPIGGGYDMGAVEYGATNAPITLAVSIVGTGTVNENPSNTTYPSGVTVTLTAIPGYGSYFAGWSGYTNNNANPLNVAMNSSVAITATFLTSPVYSLTLATNGLGSIALNPPGSSYPSNTLVTATATPSGGWFFTGWTGSAAGPTNPLSFTMNSANSLTGNFGQLPAFDVQPATKTNGVGGAVTFNAHSLGYPAPTYQWHYNGAALPGATGSSLSLNNLTLAQAGNYQVIATNQYGSAASSIVALVLTNGTGYSQPVYVCDEADLRAAVAAGGWIGFGCNGTITLTSPLTVSNNVILDGSFVNVTISGGNTVRLFNVSPGVTFGATNLTLANGTCVVTNGSPGTSADGGAIYNNGGTVTLTGCMVTNNRAKTLISGGFARGGAIFNNGGMVRLYQSVLLTNSVVGGYSTSGNTGTGLGGAIYNTNGSVTITGSTITGNISSGVVDNLYLNSLSLAMGGALFQSSGSMTITNSTLTANQALGGAGSGQSPAPPAGPAYGGAVALTGGSLSIDHSQFLVNTANGGLAGTHGIAGSAYGGAIYSAATLTASDSSFSGNGALAGAFTYAAFNGNRGMDAAGGAIYNAGNMVLNRSLVCSNYLQGGQTVSTGIANGGNGLGGGIFNASQFSATNCTIALNQALGGQGTYGFTPYAGTNGSALGGGLFNNTNAIAILMNDTIATNFCLPSSIGYDLRNSNGFTAGAQIGHTNGTVHLHNSLLAYPGANGNAYGPITDDGYNICSDGTAAFASGSSYNFTDPKLAALADNGGATLTMMPLDISPAIDTADANGAPSTDQRDRPRPAGSGYDMGAVEYGSTVPAVWLNSVHSSANTVLSFSNAPGITYYLLSSTNLTSWAMEQVIGPFSYPTNITVPVSSQGKGGKFYRLHY